MKKLAIIALSVIIIFSLGACESGFKGGENSGGEEAAENGEAPEEVSVQLEGEYLSTYYEQYRIYIFSGNEYSMKRGNKEEEFGKEEGTYFFSKNEQKITFYDNINGGVSEYEVSYSGDSLSFGNRDYYKAKNAEAAYKEKMKENYAIGIQKSWYRLDEDGSRYEFSFAEETYTFKTGYADGTVSEEKGKYEWSGKSIILFPEGSKPAQIVVAYNYAAIDIDGKTYNPAE